MSISIQRARTSDVEALHEYYTGLLDERLPYIRDNPTPTLEQECAFIEHLLDSTGDLILAFDGLDVVGMLQIDRSAHHQEDHRISIGVSVKREYRGKGIGTSLLAEARSWALEHDAGSIELEVIDNNPSISLYRRTGFEVVGRISNGFRTGDTYSDILLMQLTL